MGRKDVAPRSQGCQDARQQREGPRAGWRALHPGRQGPTGEDGNCGQNNNKSLTARPATTQRPAATQDRPREQGGLSE